MQQFNHKGEKMNNMNNYFKRIVNECCYDGIPMLKDTFDKLLKKDEKKKFMEVLLKYRKLESKFHVKIVDSSESKAMNACIVKDIYRNDKLVATETIDWDVIDEDWKNDEDTFKNEMKVIDMLEGILDNYSEDDFKNVA